MACLWGVRGHLLVIGSLLPLMGLGNQSQIFSLGGKRLNLLSHLFGPRLVILKEVTM